MRARFRKYLPAVVTVLILFAPLAKGQPLVTVRGGDLLMSITGGIPGGQPFPVVNTTARLDYRRTNIVTRITVASSCPGQKFSLKVLATGVTVGIPAPEVTLTNGMPAANFITNIPVGPSALVRCGLRYTASSTFSQG